MSGPRTAFAELRGQLEACALGVEDLEGLVLELIARAQAQADPDVVERAQAVDALAQQIRRLAAVVAEMAQGACSPEQFRERLWQLARRVGPCEAAGEMDLF